MSKSWAGGSDSQWRRIRKQVLLRDHELCQLRYPHCGTIATEVHHTIGRAASGDDLRYLVAACRSCNQQAGDPSGWDPAPTGRTRW